MQKNPVKLSYLAQKVLQRGRVPVLQLVDLPSMLTQNNGRKRPIFDTPCILPSHTGFKNIFNFAIMSYGHFLTRNGLGLRIENLYNLAFGKSQKILSKMPKYTNSLVNTNLVNTNFTNTHFQKVSIPHLTRTMKQKFLH